MKKTILIVDDDEDIIFLLKYSLEKSEYLVSIANNPFTALEKTQKKTYDLIILDVMMPKMTGLELYHKIRENPKNKNTIITFLSAKGDDISIIEGLNIGADDYILKPIKIELFLKKIESLIRRLRENSIMNSYDEDIYIDENISIDKKNYSILDKNSQDKIELTKTEFDILNLLFSEKDKIFTLKEISESIWGDGHVSSGTLYVHIKNLRTKLGNNYIKTKKGLGYVFEKNLTD